MFSSNRLTLGFTGSGQRARAQRYTARFFGDFAEKLALRDAQSGRTPLGTVLLQRAREYQVRHAIREVCRTATLQAQREHDERHGRFYTKALLRNMIAGNIAANIAFLDHISGFSTAPYIYSFVAAGMLAVYSVREAAKWVCAKRTIEKRADTLAHHALALLTRRPAQKPYTRFIEPRPEPQDISDFTLLARRLRRSVEALWPRKPMATPFGQGDRLPPVLVLHGAAFEQEEALAAVPAGSRANPSSGFPLPMIRTPVRQRPKRHALRIAHHVRRETERAARGAFPAFERPELAARRPAQQRRNRFAYQRLNAVSKA